MTETESLITAARRYCLGNHTFWAVKYSREKTVKNFPHTYTDNDYNLFSRYNILAALLDSVEMLVGQSFDNVEDCKEVLKNMALTSNNVFTTGEINEISRNAIQEERIKFIDFIDRIEGNDLKHIEPLPYKRRLSVDQSKLVRQILLDKWNFKGNYWEPIEKLSPKPTIFLMKKNITDDDYKKLIIKIKEHADNKLFEINEDGLDAEIEIELFSSDCHETIYCDQEFNWIIYGSHESTIAFGGDWLVEFIKKLFADRQDKLNKWEQNW